MIDLKAFIANPDLFEIRISVANDTPVALYRNRSLDKPGVELIFPPVMAVAAKKPGSKWFHELPADNIHEDYDYE